VPLRFVLDENQRGLLWRAIVRHNQTSVYPLDVIRVGDTLASDAWEWQDRIEFIPY
jgi:hypothetical protein